MIASGAETKRVEDTMRRILSVDTENIGESFVIATGVFAGLHGKITDTGSKFRRIEKRSIHLERIALVNSMSRNFVEGRLSLEEALKETERIRSVNTYSNLLVILGYSFVSAFFSLMFQGSAKDAIACCIVGFLLGLAVYGMEKIHISSFLISYLGSSIITIATLFLYHNSIGTNFDTIVIGCLMPLVPGVALTNSIRDILEGDFLSGTSRIIEAMITAVAIAGGVGIILQFYNIFFGAI